MKKVFALLTVLFFSFTVINCPASQKEAGEGADKNNQGKKEKKMANPQYEITVTQKGTELGKIVLELFPDVAPLHCAHFDSLVTSGFYDGLAFHRVMPGFMIQGGDPNSKFKPKGTWGQGEPGQQTVPAEFSDISHKRGILSTARRGDDINSATSQFFIVVADAAFLDKQYTVFGKVLEGMDVADKIVNSPRDTKDNPNDKIEMVIKRK